MSVGEIGPYGPPPRANERAGRRVGLLRARRREQRAGGGTAFRVRTERTVATKDRRERTSEAYVGEAPLQECRRVDSRNESTPRANGEWRQVAWVGPASEC